MRIEFRITTATHSEYVIIIASLVQQGFNACASVCIRTLLVLFIYETCQRKVCAISSLWWVLLLLIAPLQAWSGPESSRNLSFQDFVTTAQDGGRLIGTGIKSITQEVYLMMFIRGWYNYMFRPIPAIVRFSSFGWKPDDVVLLT